MRCSWHVRRSTRTWPGSIGTREYVNGTLLSLKEWQNELSSEMEFHRFAQFEFFRQWERVRDLCRRHGIRIMGDIPIYVAHDSADVWTHPELFRLDEQGQPTVMAGVPPDYFSATGQLWGNPIYRWDVSASSGHRWWIERCRASLAMFDLVRLDHFRGFEAYWEVPASASTAAEGKWVQGPGAELFRTLQTALGELPFVAENLGVITPGVEALRKEFGFPRYEPSPVCLRKRSARPQLSPTQLFS